MKSKILRGTIDHENTNNGAFYISLFQSTNEKNLLSILEEHPLLIIKNNVKVIKTLHIPICLCLTNTIFPIRYSPYSNEYQKFLYLSSKHIIGLRFSLMDANLEKNLLWMQQLMLWEEEIHKNMPYIDKETSRIINKDKVRKLSLK